MSVIGLGRLKDKEAKTISSFFTKQFPDGAFTARQVLDLARPRTSPLHKYFNWDDSLAAEKYRLEQARKLISCLVVMIDDKQVRKYVTPVRVSHYDRPVYVETSLARKDPDIWGQVLDKALRDALLWNAKYETLKQLSPIVKAISKTTKKLKGEMNA